MASATAETNHDEVMKVWQQAQKRTLSISFYTKKQLGPDHTEYSVFLQQNRLSGTNMSSKLDQLSSHVTELDTSGFPIKKLRDRHEEAFSAERPDLLRYNLQDYTLWSDKDFPTISFKVNVTVKKPAETVKTVQKSPWHDDDSTITLEESVDKNEYHSVQCAPMSLVAKKATGELGVATVVRVVLDERDGQYSCKTAIRTPE